jgi:hypothetical protein
MLDVGDGLAEKLPDVVVVQRIDHVPPIALTGNESEVPQYAKLVGYRRGFHADMLRQVAYRTR